MKMEADLRHIVAKMGVLALPAAGRRRDMLENEAFLIFAYLRATERALENNRFSLLVKCHLLSTSTLGTIRHLRVAVIIKHHVTVCIRHIHHTIALAMGTWDGYRL